MSDKTHVLTRRGDLYTLNPSFDGRPNGYNTENLYEVEFFRANSNVEDRTRYPDYSSVPVGTAGTATVRGVKGVRVMRRDDGWWGTWRPVSCLTDTAVLVVEDDADVTDFRPDVVVDEALIERVTSAYAQNTPLPYLIAILRGESS